MLIRRDRHLVVCGFARDAGGQLNWTNEWVQLPDGAARQVCQIISLTRTRLIVDDIGLSSNQNRNGRSCGSIVLPDNHVAVGPCQSVGIIQIEDCGPRLVATVDTGDCLNVASENGCRIIQVELEKVLVSGRLHTASDGKRRLIRLQQVAQLNCSSRTVVVTNFVPGCVDKFTGFAQ